MDAPKKYQMTINLNVLNHLGINLYSNIPAVLSEVVANSWDADATNVDIETKLKFLMDSAERRIPMPPVEEDCSRCDSRTFESVKAAMTKIRARAYIKEIQKGGIFL